MISSYISLPVFLISFILGVFVSHIIGPTNNKVYVYPSPNNYSFVQYRDNAGQCFEFDAVKTKCPINPLFISKVPIQT